MSEQSEFVVEYPDGTRMRITEDGVPISAATLNTPPPIIKFSEILETLPDPFPTLTPRAVFPARTGASETSTHAAAEVLLAVIALQKACARMIETSLPINRAECEALVDFGRQRLQVVALAIPLLGGG